MSARTSLYAGHSGDEVPALQDAPSRRFEASGVDPSDASTVYAEAYGGGRFRVVPSSRDFSYRYAYVGNDRVTLRTSECDGALSGEVTHLTEYVVSWFRRGGGVLSLDRPGRPRTTSPFLFPSEQRFDLDFQPHRQNLVHFGPSFFEDVATEFHAGPRQRVAFEHGTEAEAEMIPRWRETVSKATAAIVEAATAPLVRFTAELNLARALLVLFPWRAWDVPAVLRQPSASRARVALDFMQHRAHDPITPADAARAAGLHTRTLQQATQRHLGMSPSMYLRNVRLDRVHTQLAAADPCSISVRSVAREWGFGNLGRFSTVYLQRFGEKPHQTLRS